MDFQEVYNASHQAQQDSMDVAASQTDTREVHGTPERSQTEDSRAEKSLFNPEITA